MRLINTTTLQMEQFHPRNVPPYAILSHTWGPEEVTSGEFQAKANTTQAKAGYKKIMGAAAEARRLPQAYEYLWVDTCCIDKTKSAEVAEDINAMYQYYRNAQVCLAFLADVRPKSADNLLFRSRWFTRGWTLQELIAPRTLIFYDAAWTQRGSKACHIKALVERTRVPSNVLLGKAAPTEFSVAQRMAWAAGRETERAEDVAYCLLGIFDVNMPLIYGEGTNAFRRLQEEIIMHSSDQTIFAWNLLRPGGTVAHRNASTTSTTRPEPCLFATSPALFSPFACLQPMVENFENFSVTNRGLFVSGSVSLRMAEVPVNGSSGATKTIYTMFLGHQTGGGGVLLAGLPLLKIGPNEFRRDWATDLVVVSTVDEKRMRSVQATDFYIQIDRREPNMARPEQYRQAALHVPAAAALVVGGWRGEGVAVKFMMQGMAPANLWDAHDRIFLRPRAHETASSNVVLVLQFDVVAPGGVASLVVLGHYRTPTAAPTVFVYDASVYPHETAMLLMPRSPDRSLTWPELNMLCTPLRGLTNSVVLRFGVGKAARRVRVNASTVPARVNLGYAQANVHSLRLEVTKA